MASVDEVLTALRARGLDADLVMPRGSATLTGINVWTDPADRVPAATVWPPHSGHGWTWGAAFEAQAPETLDAPEVAARVHASLS